MPIYKPTELRKFLDELGLRPKKGLSQNFLIDGNIIRKIAALTVVQDEVILEVGPGPGSLTEILLEKGATVIAVEMDTILGEALNRLQTEPPRLTVHLADILKFPFEKELTPFLKNGKKAKLIANLPYHLTTPILAKFLPRVDLFSSITVMVQEEVARRLTGQPGTENYSCFTLFVNFYSRPHYAFTVTRHCFYPPPKVDSAVIHFELKEAPKIDHPELFFTLTRTAFNQRRKMLRVALKNLYPTAAVSAALEFIGIDPTIRAEMLSLEDFIQLYQRLKIDPISTEINRP